MAELKKMLIELDRVYRYPALLSAEFLCFQATSSQNKLYLDLKGKDR